MNLLDGLNSAQKEAVLHIDGPLLVLAGAGAGKTKAISHRVAHLVQNGVSPEKILAITFTNKAAGEMRERIGKLLAVSHQPSAPFVSTFHSLGVYILRNHGRGVGVLKGFTILDRDDAQEIIKQAIENAQMDPKQFPPGKIQSIISRMKGDLVDCEEFSAQASSNFYQTKIADVWLDYEKNLKSQNSLDFDDLILKPVVLFRTNSEAREYYQNLWKYILIDEYQDTNKSQYEFSKILAEKHRNVCVIGDADQAIYSWRGADFRNIIKFEVDYPEHKAIVLEENYRSTKNILEAAAKVIEKNKMRKPKKLTAVKDRGEEISFFEAMNEQEEAEFVIHKANEFIENGMEPTEMAVLFRANFQSRVFEEACLKHKVAYQMLGTQFYQRKEVKDLFAYLRTAMNPDDLTSMKRAINSPARGIGKVSFLNKLVGKPLPAMMAQRFFDFDKIISAIREKIENGKPSDVIRFVIKKSGLQEDLEKRGEEGQERLENLKELVTIATKYDDMEADLAAEPPSGGSAAKSLGIEKLLTDAALISDQDSLDKKKNGIRLMTVHSAKGLEFKIVFIVGLEEGLFPYASRGEDAEDKKEEERRLFYVALTRAKEKVFLTYSVARTIFGSLQVNMLSRFLSDIPPELLKVEEYEKKEEIIEYL